jgi:hypothetical protein
VRNAVFWVGWDCPVIGCAFAARVACKALVSLCLYVVPMVGMVVA